jgi:peptidyl-prolyl cis-trans isomerase A (cyclophilin A)
MIIMRALFAPVGLAAALSLSASLSAQDPAPRVYFDTDRGPIIVELDPVAAPLTTQNFVDYVESGFYDGLVFHRIFNGYIIEGGEFDRDLAARPPLFEPIPSEADNGLLNLNGTIAMANGGDPDAGQASFYFNLADNDVLDGDYTVFGDVIAGQATLQAIENAFRHPDEQLEPTSLPVSPTLIKRAVAYQGDFPVLPLHSGSWYNPATAGTGFALEVTTNGVADASPIAVIYWYDFNAGEPLWLTGSAGFEFGDTEVTIDLAAVPNPAPSVGFQIPPPPSAFDPAGTVTIRFTACGRGVFAYDLIDFGTGEIPVQRLTLPDGANCAAFEG